MQDAGKNRITMELGTKELETVKKVLHSFISLFKTYTLYPSNHSISQNNLAKFLDELDSFVNTYQTLRLETRKNNFYYKGEQIFTGQAEENNPAYLLARDGLEYIEFIQGVASHEISAFINLLIKYRNPFEEVEGDIVTALWQNNFSHILYQEVDIFTLESFEFDLSTFKVTPDTSGAAERIAKSDSRPASMREPAGRMEEGILAAAASEKGMQETQGQSAVSGTPESITPAEQNRFLSEQGMSLLEITAEEKEILADSVLKEENKNFTSDVIDVLLVILVTQNTRDNFSYTLEFLEFEFFETMDRAEFHLVYKLLNNLLIIRKQFSSSRPWSVPLIDGFIAGISGKEKFEQIRWAQNDDFSWVQSPYLSQLWQILRMLAPQIVFTLGRLLNSIPVANSQVRNEILKIIEIKAKEDPEILGNLLAESDQQLNLLLAPVLYSLPPEEASRIYLRMTRHSSAEVRKTGLDGYILSENNPDYDRLFHLLGDNNPLIRNRAVNYLMNAGEEIAAPLLIRYLSEYSPDDRPDQKTIIRHYYKALASCASVDSLPFLEKKLMESKLIRMFGNSSAIHREGAAFALKTIGTNEALAILEKGAKSLKPDIRFASRKALDS